ncbi:hypothetical protein CY34DRAFT_713966 [Suillus luteus UH-Slu-Lm8-n1]|uniref:Uncharacterized protein n=1 Tax=Suillus luteus UH-Slu-Lm8-n1 TaxID=930992 RepID=A0A0C9Z755_9AGAM|nr:hypothetical protein CY34DRAFT_713966 [Suillus luteus UH-Slu-Lm8-n1]
MLTRFGAHHITWSSCRRQVLTIVASSPSKTQSSARPFTGTLLKNHPKNKYYHFYRFQLRLFCSSLLIPFYTRALSCPTPILDWHFRVKRARKSLDGGDPEGKYVRRVRAFLYWHGGLS